MASVVLLACSARHGGAFAPLQAVCKRAFASPFPGPVAGLSLPPPQTPETRHLPRARCPVLPPRRHTRAERPAFCSSSRRPTAGTTRDTTQYAACVGCACRSRMEARGKTRTRLPTGRKILEQNCCVPSVRKGWTISSKTFLRHLAVRRVSGVLRTRSACIRVSLRPRLHESRSDRWGYLVTPGSVVSM